ncbi:MAG: NADH-quinone oxidoreductase subunit A [Acidobacteria bacterium]|nr:NADH-quinone oxidoreductase subunit A [Acidobacteriota bacterium]
MRAYAAILLLALVAACIPVAVWTLAYFVAPKFPNPTKATNYECGITSPGEAREKFHVRYYLIAVMFLVFDVESVFLFPFAVQFKELALFGIIEIGIFLFLLLFGYFYIWKKGALNWE